MDTNDTASIVDFTSYITERTRDFTGREWVFQAIQAWLADTHGPRFFLLTGNPGSGKSAIAARLAQFSQGSISSPGGCPLLAPNFLSALHFCSARDRRWINPMVFAESLALQLGARYQPFAEALAEKREDRRISIEVTQSATNMTGGQMAGIVIHKLNLSGISAEDAFTRVVREPLEVLLGQEADQQVIVMVDALDEALTYTGDMNIVSLLAQVEYLPPVARFILTSRKVEEIERAFRNATRFFLSFERFKAKNQEDIDHFVAVQLLRNEQLATKVSTLPPENVENLRTEITRKAAGNFLYIRFLLDAIAGGQRPLTQLEGLPEGLDGLYLDSLERVIKLGKHSWHEEYAPLMGVLLVVQESVTQTQLAALTGQAESDIWEYLGDFQQFLEQVAVSVKEGEKRYHLYHQSVVDFLNQQWLVVDHEELRNPFYCSMKEWHRKVADRCEQGDIMRVWEDERHDLVEQSRREYARQYYITHLYLAQAWQRLFAVLDEGAYGRAKVHYDTSTRSYAQDLDLGRQAAALGGWTREQGIMLLPRLWRYMLLRCSLSSRADQYPLALFQLLLLVNREPEVLGLVELLTNPLDKVEVLLHTAQYLTFSKRQSESIQLLLEVFNIANTIETLDERAKILSKLAGALAKAGQWDRAEEVVFTIEDSDARAKALNELVTALIDAGHFYRVESVWKRAEEAALAIENSVKRAEALSGLAIALTRAKVWDRAKEVVFIIEESNARAKALNELVTALIKDDQWDGAEEAAQTIEDNNGRAKTLSELADALAKTCQWDRAEEVVFTIEDSDARAKALNELVTALVDAGHFYRVESVWKRAEEAALAIENSVKRAEALSGLAIALTKLRLRYLEEVIAFDLERGFFYGLGTYQWDRVEGVRRLAEEVASVIEDSKERAKALIELATAPARAGLWEAANRLWQRAEEVLATREDYRYYWPVGFLEDALIQAGQWDWAEGVWKQAKQAFDAIETRDDRTEISIELALALTQAGQWSSEVEIVRTRGLSYRGSWILSELEAVLSEAEWRNQLEIWERAEEASRAIEDRDMRVRALSNLATALTRAFNGKPGRGPRDTWLKEAILAFVEAGQWDHAEEAIRDIMDSDKRAEALCGLGTALVHAGQWDHAEKVAHTIKNSKEKTKVLKELARTLTKAGQWDHAEEVIHTIDTRHKRAEALSELALALAEEFQWDRVKRLCSEAEEIVRVIEDSDERADALSELARALAEAGQWDHVEEVAHAIEIQDKRAGVLKNLATTLTKVKQWDWAERAWRQAIEAAYVIEDSNKRAWALRGLASALAEEAQWDSAEGMWRQMIEATRTIEDSDKRAWALRDLATTLTKVDQWDWTKRVWRKVIEVAHAIKDSNKRAWILSELASILAEGRQWDSAEGVWRQAEEAVDTIQDNYERTWALSDLARNLVKAGQLDHAEKVVQAIKTNDTKAEALTVLAIAFVQADQWDRAESIWMQMKVIALATKDSYRRIAIMSELVISLAKAGQWERAEEAARDIENSYERSRMLKELVTALIEAEQWDRAERVTQSIEVRDKKSQALSELAIALIKAEQLNRAENITQAIEIRDEKAGVMSRLAIALAQASQWDRAEKVAQVIEIRKERAWALSELTVALAQASQWDRAEKVAHMIESSDIQVWSLSQLATTLAKAEQWGHAERILMEAEGVIHAIEDINEKASVWGGLTYNLIQAGLWDRAEKAAHAIKNSHLRSRMMRELATALIQASQWEQAEKIARIIEDRRERDSSLYELAIALAKADYWDRAENVSQVIETSYLRAWVWRELGTILLINNKYEHLLSLVHRSWLQAETRAYAFLILPLAFGFIPFQPETASDFFMAFKWVDGFFNE